MNRNPRSLEISIVQSNSFYKAKSAKLDTSLAYDKSIFMEQEVTRNTTATAHGGTTRKVKINTGL